MARIRYLKPDFFKDEDIASLAMEVRLFYTGLWCLADREGRLEDREKRLKVEIFPYDNIDINKCLETLAAPKPATGLPFIKRYEIKGNKYIQILSWHRHQRIHHTERSSIIPSYSNKNNKNKKIGRKGKVEGRKLELSNGSLTVKKPLRTSVSTEIVGYWNEKKTLPRVAHLSEERKTQLRSRVANKHFLDNYKPSIDKISSSRFCCGRNEKKWKATFDWFIKNDNNYVKALEGKYDNDVYEDYLASQGRTE
jgi:hypothetical protein